MSSTPLKVLYYSIESGWVTVSVVQFSSQRLDSIQVATWNCRGLYSLTSNTYFGGEWTSWCCRSTGSGLLSWDLYTPILHTLLCAIVVSCHPQHSHVAVEAALSSGESQYLPSQSPTLTPTGSVVFNFLSKVCNYSPLLAPTCQALSILRKPTTTTSLL